VRGGDAERPDGVGAVRRERIGVHPHDPGQEGLQQRLGSAGAVEGDEIFRQ
jgi:hypothetical protein